MCPNRWQTFNSEPIDLFLSKHRLLHALKPSFTSLRISRPPRVDWAKDLVWIWTRPRWFEWLYQKCPWFGQRWHTHEMDADYFSLDRPCDKETVSDKTMLTWWQTRGFEKWQNVPHNWCLKLSWTWVFWFWNCFTPSNDVHLNRLFYQNTRFLIVNPCPWDADSLIFHWGPPVWTFVAGVVQCFDFCPRVADEDLRCPSLQCFDFWFLMILF